MAKRKRRRQKDALDLNKKYKYIIYPCSLVLIGSLIFFIWYQNNRNSTYTNIQYIRSFMTSSGQLNDFQNKIGCSGIKDIKWYLTDKEVRIEFGRIILDWEPDKFIQKENIALLETIGITAKSIDGKLKLYYQGEEIERWVK